MFRARLMPWHLLVGLVLFAAVLPVHGKDKASGEGEAAPAHHDGEAAHAKPKYKAEVDEGGKEVPKDFDLSKPEDEKALLEAIRHGHVGELRKDEPPTLQKLFSLTADLGLWSLVVFGLLLFVLSRIAWPKMIAGLKAREDRIRGALEEAQKTKDEAQALHARFQKDMADAQAQAAKVIDDARKAGQAVADEVSAKARAEIQAERERLQREIEMQTNQAIQRIWSQAADLATLVSAKALGRGITEDGHRKLIDEALAEIKASAPGANGHA